MIYSFEIKFNNKYNERTYSRQYTVLDTYIYTTKLYLKGRKLKKKKKKKEGNYNTKFKISII